MLAIRFLIVAVLCFLGVAAIALLYARINYWFEQRRPFETYRQDASGQRWYSRDGGATWTKVPALRPVHIRVGRLTIQRDRAFPAALNYYWGGAGHEHWFMTSAPHYVLLPKLRHVTALHLLRGEWWICTDGCNFRRLFGGADWEDRKAEA